MFHKDTIRLIKKTFNRFISLLMIVLIGSAFMMGLLSTRTIMEDNVDRYADDLSLQDIQFYSSYGFCDEDIEALKKLECIDEVFASRFRDVFDDELMDLITTRLRRRKFKGFTVEDIDIQLVARPTRKLKFP